MYAKQLLLKGKPQIDGENEDETKFFNELLQALKSVYHVKTYKKYLANSAVQETHLFGDFVMYFQYTHKPNFQNAIAGKPICSNL